MRLINYDIIIPDGRRNVGRQKLRWLDVVEVDLKALGVRRWRTKTQDRSEWFILSSISVLSNHCEVNVILKLDIEESCLNQRN